MKKRGKKKWIGIIAAAVMVLAAAAVFAWKYLGDREPEVPDLDVKQCEAMQVLYKGSHPLRSVQMNDDIVVKR
ncbi:MAG: hypothetical protein IKS10_09530 [Lachnospiraceae bacterium]|nr:hypothetical protein [Lachnospiraceae bacterium]